MILCGNERKPDPALIIVLLYSLSCYFYKQNNITAKNMHKFLIKTDLSFRYDKISLVWIRLYSKREKKGERERKFAY